MARTRSGPGRLAVATTIAIGLALSPTTAPGMASDPPIELAGTAWRLVELRSMDDAIGVVRPDDRSSYTLHFHPDSTVSMRLACNRATGTWSATPTGDGTGGRLELSSLAVTRALCPPPSLDERIAAEAGYVRSYLLEEGRLYLSLMADGGIQAWEPDPAAAPPVAPDHGGPRNWQVVAVSPWLNLRASPSTSAPVVGRYAAGTILDNLGCRATGDRIWCDVQELGGGPRGFVAHDFLTPAVSPDGSVATGPDDPAARAGRGDFDATGPLPCTLPDDVPGGDCEFGVARTGGGYATVVITKPDGRTRLVYFRMGIPIGVGFSEADAYDELTMTRRGDVHVIEVDDERYEIPDAVILGG